MILRIVKKANPNLYINVDIDPGGMSVAWVDERLATRFYDRASADSMVARIVERYTDEVVIREG